MADNQILQPTPKRTLGLMSLLRRGRRNQSGATMVEFALVLPAFLAMLFSIFEVGMLFFKQMLLDDALQSASRSILVGDTQTSITPATAAAVEAAFKTEICNGSFFYKSSCNDVKIQVLAGDAEINANRNILAPINSTTSPPTITIPASQGFSNLPATPGSLIIRVYAPAKTLIAKLNGIGLTMASGDTVLISSTAFFVEPYLP